MEQILQKENNINNSNKQSTLDTNKNSILFYNSGNYFSFGKDNTIASKLTPNTSSFNLKENIKKSEDNIITNSFLKKKRKLMTSEELELEQIERERKEVKKMMQKNMELYYRTKSGTTTIVSKIRDNIYNTNNNTINKSAILNDYIKNNNNNINDNKFNFHNNQNINKNNSYALNFMKEKLINKIKDAPKNDKSIIGINNTEIINNPPKENIIEIINTDIIKDNKVSVKNENDKKQENIIDLDEDKEKEGINNAEEIEDKKKVKEIETENVEKEYIAGNSASKTPNKESSYLTKMKQLGSMSKLSLCNKIEKYTEICQEVLKEQRNEEDIKEEKKNEKKRQKKKNKRAHHKK